jgi:hypothetical protein
MPMIEKTSSPAEQMSKPESSRRRQTAAGKLGMECSHIGGLPMTGNSGALDLPQGLTATLE